MTTARSNSLHYGSDIGAEMAATYHSIISTVKLHGKSVWGNYSAMDIVDNGYFNGKWCYIEKC